MFTQLMEISSRSPKGDSGPNGWRVASRFTLQGKLPKGVEILFEAPSRTLTWNPEG